MNIVKPKSYWVGASAKKLCALEERRNGIIKECAVEWAKYNSVSLENFWGELLPQALFDILGSFQAESAIAAATAYLEYRGFTVTKNEDPKTPNGRK